jgi:SAM-dependent methyltransferase
MALPIKGGVDVTYCVGVLHHLEDPQRGFVELVNRLAPGGRIAVWVYSAEGNEWFVRFVEPLRRCLTSKLSPSLVQVLALPMAGILWLGALITRGYFGKRLRLPLHNYLRFQGQFGFRYLWLTVFDKLAAPEVHYVTKADLGGWFAASHLGDVTISFRNDTGWRASGTASHGGEGR